MIVQSGNNLALEGAGLTGVSTDVANAGVIQDALVGFVQGVAVGIVGQRLTVDEDQGDTGFHHHVDNGIGGGGLDQVQDDDIHALGDEVLHLVGLLGHVVLAVGHGDVILHGVGFQGLEVGFDLVAVQGHKVVVEGVDGAADLIGLDLFGGGHAGQAHNHDDCQNHCEDLLHRILRSFLK